ncbi:VanW family protein [Rhodococcus gannanensis]|uniref:VanW family protein n=1 Tax=Rhodococcus gannanensis TaxID=1960308 RepID=A0ABW4P7J7_9NOCA
MSGGIGKHSGAPQRPGFPHGESPDSVRPAGEPADTEPTTDAGAPNGGAGQAVEQDGVAETEAVTVEVPTAHVRPEDVPTTVLPRITPDNETAPAPGPGPAPQSAPPGPAVPPGPSVAGGSAPPPVPPSGPVAPDGAGGDSGRPGRGGAAEFVRNLSARQRIAVGAAAGVLAVGGVWYVLDLATSAGAVPRGVTVAGVDVGGLSHEDAEATLRAALDPRAQQPVTVRAGDVTTDLVPAEAGLAVDWPATIDRVGSQPLNPITRLTSYFTEREVGVTSTHDDVALAAAVEGLRPQTDRAPVEGAVRFDGATPVGVSPQAGQSLDADGAAAALTDGWAAVGGVEVPVTVESVTVTQSGVDEALRDVATPAVAANVEVTGRDDKKAVLARDQIGTVLSFVPNGDGGLDPQYGVDAAIGVLGPQLASTEVAPKDATFSLDSGSPTVVPAVPGDMIEWHKTLEALPALLAGESGDRTTAAIYEPKQPELTTDAAKKLGINEVIGQFTSGGFEYASGVNIRLAASEIDGALVKPGATFSLNEYTGPRGTAEGYVASGIINNGRPDRAVGGGISQLATTLYNAAYFGGMEDAGHTEHSYYISRYPEAREATVFEGAIDLKFTNATDTGVLIQTIGTNSDITVKLWGTKHVDVESVTGERYAHTSPNTVTLPAGSDCIASGGAQGFTTSDTRIVTDHGTGAEISRETRTVKYDPVPIVRCETAQPAPAPAPAAPAAAPATPAATTAQPTAAERRQERARERDRGRDDEDE